MNPLKSIGQIILDILEVIGLFTTTVVIYPLLWTWRQLHQSALMARYLLPKALLGAYFQARFLNHFGQFEKAMIIYNELLIAFEGDDIGSETTHNVPLNRFVQRLYQDFMACYIALGDLDQAASILIRAHKRIGCQCLPKYSEFSLQTAHIIKAGFAAGRLLDDEGIKGLFQSGKSIIIKAAPYRGDYPKSRDDDSLIPSSGAKILPFRRPESI